MPEVSQAQLEEFGRKVKTARAFKGWTLDQLAHKALSRDNAKGYLSQIEKGKRRITARTAAQIIKALDMDQDDLAPFIDGAEVAEDEVTEDDTKAERMLQMAQRDQVAPGTSEALLISLAYEFAHGNHRDVFSSFQGLRAALQEAAELKARGNLPQNVDAQLQAVMQRVARLNDEGNRDDAQAEIDEAIKRNAAERSVLCDLALSQARIRNDPEAAANLVITQLREEIRLDRLFETGEEIQRIWRQSGHDKGLRFDKEVALWLARRNYERSKGPNEFYSIFNLGVALSDLGEQETGTKRLKSAVKALRQAAEGFGKIGDKCNLARIQIALAAAYCRLFDHDNSRSHLLAAERAARMGLKLLAGKSDPEVWTNAQEELGNTLSRLGELENNPSVVRDAIAALEDVQSIRSREYDARDWAGTQTNLGLARLRLGRIERDLALLDAAQANFDASLTVKTRTDWPFHWAYDQWNLADLALARFEIAGDPSQLDTAQAHLGAAREVFAEGLSHHQLKRCDELQTRIDAARQHP